MGFVDELKWRGMVQDFIPGVEEQLEKEMTAGYAGFDPTADSLHVGNLVTIMLLRHFQLAGHKPIALVGGATGMVGDPSGKKAERQFLSEDILQHNLACIKDQLAQFLDFDCGENAAEIVNNYDWFKEMSILDFLRDVGKHISVNYMVAKDSVKTRMETGISFTEFSYQLIQGYDFYHLNQSHNCKLQMGGSDQWGNITTGTELIRRKGGSESYALTSPLITKADGSKFGKSEGGNIWLDREKTSPYEFYQFWLNASDEDALSYIKIFTFLSQSEIEDLAKQQAEAPHLRAIQKKLAEIVTSTVHSQKDFEDAKNASEVLFGKINEENLKSFDNSVFEALKATINYIPVAKSDIESNISIVDFLAENTAICQSKGEARRSLKQNSISLNKVKIQEDKTIGSTDLINDKYLFVQNGKKKYYLLGVE